MPTYSYRCTECGTAFDIQQAFTDESLTECPNCQGALRKLFSAVGVSFTGSGFYRNDSRSSSAPTDSSVQSAQSAPSSEGASAGSSSASASSASSGASSGASTPSTTSAST